MTTRTDLINFFIETYKYKNYLEIGFKKGSNFNSVNCENKEAVDIDSTFFSRAKNVKQLYNTTSDIFFEKFANGRKWDLIFVDGDHEKTQVKKDIENSLLHLNSNGIIICHDVNPKEEYLITKKYCGDAWEAFVELRCTRSDLEMHGVTFDHSGFIKFGKQELYSDSNLQYTWKFLEKNRKQLMNELTVDEIIDLYKK